MKYSIEIIKQIVHENPSTEIIYFCGHSPKLRENSAFCLSQWYDCYFEINGVQYHTAEQYMMANKALMFHDKETYLGIMMAYNPLDYKKLGRRILGFMPELWDARKFDIVVEGNKAKFSQNPELKDFLLSTGDAILAEASPSDKIWGVGLDIETAEMGGIEQWQGENMLGCALMEVRDWIKEIEEHDVMDVLQMWTMGAGNSAKRFNGENPIPEKTKVATKDSWHIEPMPEKSVVIPMYVPISREAMCVIKQGHIPDAMEDHWFMYCDDSTIRYYRSWTGHCIYIATYEDQGELYRITSLQLNGNPEQYSYADEECAKALFMALLTEEYGGDASEYWRRAL